MFDLPPDAAQAAWSLQEFRTDLKLFSGREQAADARRATARRTGGRRSPGLHAADAVIRPSSSPPEQLAACCRRRSRSGTAASEGPAEDRQAPLDVTAANLDRRPDAGEVGGEEARDAVESGERGLTNLKAAADQAHQVVVSSTQLPGGRGHQYRGDRRRADGARRRHRGRRRRRHPAPGQARFAHRPRTVPRIADGSRLTVHGSRLA